MKVFISYDSQDSQLAYQLKTFLKEKGIEGYVFDITPEYDKTLHAKITAAINDSVALVAIITNENTSTSVHEEIGYAIAKEKSVIIMIENNADDGVLSHEREKEVFTRDDFENSCKRIHEYLKTYVKNKIIKIEKNIKKEDFLLYQFKSQLKQLYNIFSGYRLSMQFEDNTKAKKEILKKLQKSLDQCLDLIELNTAKEIQNIIDQTENFPRITLTTVFQMKVHMINENDQSKIPDIIQKIKDMLDNLEQK